MFVSGQQTEIFETVYCLIVHLSFLTSYNPLFFSLCKNSKKQHFRFICRFFSRKTVQISTFKVEYLENGLVDLNDFGLIFCRILNGLLDEINLFLSCSSPGLKSQSSHFSIGPSDAQVMLDAL